MFQHRHYEWLAAWCRNLSFGNYASTERRALLIYVAVDLAHELDRSEPRFNPTRFLRACGITKEELDAL